MKTINSKAGAAIGAGLLLTMALGAMPATAVAEPADVDGATAEATAYTPDWSLVAPATFYDSDGTFLAVRYYWKAQPLTIWQYYPAPRDGYTFEGWAIKGKEADGVVDPKSVPMSVDGMTFVAAWQKDEVPVTMHTVTFVDRGSVVGTVEVEDGETVAKPADDPTFEGYDFHGWSINSKAYEAYDFSTPVTSDITLYSFYTESANPTDPTDPIEPTPEEPADKSDEHMQGADKASDKKASDKEKLPQTGDPISFALIAGSGFTAVAAIASGIFLKRRNN